MHSQIFDEKECNSIKMFKIIEKAFVLALKFFGSLSNVNSLECVSMKIKNVK